MHNLFGCLCRMHICPGQKGEYYMSSAFNVADLAPGATRCWVRTLYFIRLKMLIVLVM